MYFGADHSENVTDHLSMNTMSWDEEGKKPVPRHAVTVASAAREAAQLTPRKVVGRKRGREAQAQSTTHHYPYDADEDSCHSSSTDGEDISCNSSISRSTSDSTRTAAKAIPSMFISSSVSSGSEHHQSNQPQRIQRGQESSLKNHSASKPGHPFSSSVSVPLDWNRQQRQRLKRPRSEQVVRGAPQQDILPRTQPQPVTQQQRLQQVESHRPQLISQQQQGQPQPALVKSGGGLSLTLRPAFNQREQFLMFIKILFRMLDEDQTARDGNTKEGGSATILERAKMIVGECTVRNRDNDPAYVNLADAVHQRLQPIIPVPIWERSQRMLVTFLRNQYQQRQQLLGQQQQQQQLLATTASTEKSDSSTSDQRLTTVAV